MVDDRKMDVLRAVVSDYIETREPVGSKALVERHHLGVSSATIRNDMAALEEEGYLAQPHTSAGRVPTDKGYRYFVDRLAGVKPLSAPERRAIQTFLAGAADLDDIIHRTVRLLAELTNQVALVQYPVSDTSTVRHVELISISPERLMVIVIDSTGRVDQRSVVVHDASDDDLARMRDLLNTALTGVQRRAAVDALADLDMSAAGLEAFAELVETVAAMVQPDAYSEVVVAGVPNLTGFGAAYQTGIRPLLETLEEQVVLLRLLGEAAVDHPGEVSVRIGTENSYEPLQTTSLVASGYGDDDIWANLAVVGPTYMDYSVSIAAVRGVAHYLGHFLIEG